MKRTPVGFFRIEIMLVLLINLLVMRFSYWIKLSNWWDLVRVTLKFTHNFQSTQTNTATQYTWDGTSIHLRRYIHLLMDLPDYLRCTKTNTLKCMQSSKSLVKQSTKILAALLNRKKCHRKEKYRRWRCRCGFLKNFFFNQIFSLFLLLISLLLCKIFWYSFLLYRK